MTESSGIRPVTDADFDESVLRSDLLTIVDFWAPWCGPCRIIAPILAEIATDYEGRVRIAKMNVDESPETPQKYGISAIPTLLFFKNGELVDRVTGIRPRNEIEQLIERGL